MSEKLRILLVDDNEVNLDVLGRRLERKGCEVVAVTTGRAALVTLEEETFDAVVLDLRMPEMTGHDVLREIRALRTQVELPVIMATAETDPDEMVRALEGGANDYVTKPIDANVLMARIRAQLRARVTAPPAQVAVAVPAPTALGIGVVIQGRYRLDALLGSGGFGSVYRARHLKLDTDVALKILHPHLLTATSIRRRFEQEAISTCRVKHPNAVQVLDASATDAGLPYLVMELLTGSTLAEALDYERCFRLRRVVEILKPVCDVLEEAHRVGIVHRDVKPANVMLTRSNDGELVKVLDFGIAKFVDREKQLGLTGDGVVGTPLFMSPEALLGRPTCAASDVFSVGVTAYLMLAGDPPHGVAAKNPFEQAIRQVHNAPAPLATARPDLPIEVVQILMATMAHEPENRPPLAELRDTLVEHARGFSEADWPPSSATGARAAVASGPTVHLGDVPSIPRFDAPASGVVPSEGAETGQHHAEESGERQHGDEADSAKSTRRGGV